MFKELVCLLHATLGQPINCAEKADYYEKYGNQYEIDPYLLFAIDIQECNLLNKHRKYYIRKKNKKILTHMDTCPMGIRQKNANGINPLTLKDSVERSAKLLHSYKAYHSKEKEYIKRTHSFSGHYNWGYKIYKTGKHSYYDNKVENLRKALHGQKVNLNALDKRTKKLVQIINKHTENKHYND